MPSKIFGAFIEQGQLNDEPDGSTDKACDEKDELDLDRLALIMDSILLLQLLHRLNQSPQSREVSYGQHGVCDSRQDVNVFDGLFRFDIIADHQENDTGCKYERCGEG